MSLLARRCGGSLRRLGHRRFSSETALTKSWLCSGGQFPLQNLPYGVFQTEDTGPRCCVAIGNHALDLGLLAERGLFDGLEFDATTLCDSTLNRFMAQEPEAWAAARSAITDLLADGGSDVLRESATLRAEALVPLDSLEMLLPVKIGDYTDFYSSREHATNVGIMFRGVDNALQPNWLHLPVGYHGRASSVVPSGTPIRRPSGQLQVGDEAESTFGACKLLDFELEMGFFVGGSPPPLGESIAMKDADKYIFGMVLLNDWSARDIQKWEYVPLGPFGAKNFGTTISPWIVPMAALEPFKCPTSAGEQTDPLPLPYLQDPEYGSYDINLEVLIQGEDMEAAEPVTRSNFANLYWNVKQQLVHHSVTGCNMQVGDLLGSGTISGQVGQDAPTPEPMPAEEATAKLATNLGRDPSETELKEYIAGQGLPSYGSMLELSWRGARDIPLGAGGESRKFLRDGDSVSVRGWCQGEGYTIGFGDCEGTIRPAAK